MRYDLDILSRLYKIYDKRIKKSPVLVNKISLKLNKAQFPEYFLHINDYDIAIDKLEKEEFIMKKFLKHDTVVDSIILNIDRIDEIIEFLGVSNSNDEINSFLNELASYDNPYVASFRAMLEERRSSKKPITQYLGRDYLDAAKAISYIDKLDHDIYERDISNKIFKDSKRISNIRTNILKIYNSDNEELLREKGILQVPSYLQIKGEGEIKVNNQIIDLAKVGDPIGICLNENSKIELINPSRVTTIENLTTFFDYKASGIIIYLGGFPTKSELKVLKEFSNSLECIYHFGDIDYGGYSILNNLMSNLSCKVEGIHMDLATILANQKHLISFKSDKNRSDYILRLKALLNNPKLSAYSDAIEYLIANEVWLEQESFYNK